MMSHAIRWRAVHAQLRERLLAARAGQPFWLGRLADSALATATAAAALAVGGSPADRGLIDAALRWLTRNQNADGGWGDTPQSPSNLPATLLTLAAFRLAGASPPPDAQACAERQGGVAAVARLYGGDRTFSVPILTCCAIAGLADWSAVPPLPMELAALPRRTFRLLGLPVVSYALPALIAMGLVHLVKRPPRNLLLRWLRQAVTGRVLRRLEAQ